MKILFSEFKSDYSNYIFPYAIWAFPEDGETPSQIFGRGYLPASLKLQRYYMCRHIRVKLADFTLSSENRRIMRKGEGLTYRLIPIEEFDYTDDWREFCKTYADIKFGKDVMTYQRLDSLFHSKVVTHLLIYHDPSERWDIGIVTLYLEKDKMAYYYYSFYDLNYYSRNLGMYMMTSAVDYFSGTKKAYMYLGSCYSRNALYKTQFSGAEFFNGVKWSTNIKELKYLIERDKGAVKKHLLESETYLEKFHDGDLNRIVDAGDVIIKLD